MPIDIKLWPLRPELDEDYTPVPIEIEDADFMSFVNHETYGKPAIIAPGPDHVSAGEGEITVVYININAFSALEATKR